MHVLQTERPRLHDLRLQTSANQHRVSLRAKAVRCHSSGNAVSSIGITGYTAVRCGGGSSERPDSAAHLRLAQ